MIIERIRAEVDRKDARVTGIVMHPATWAVLKTETMTSDDPPIVYWYVNLPTSYPICSASRLVVLHGDVPIGELLFAKVAPSVRLKLGGLNWDNAERLFQEIKEMQELFPRLQGPK